MKDGQFQEETTSKNGQPSMKVLEKQCSLAIAATSWLVWPFLGSFGPFLVKMANLRAVLILFEVIWPRNDRKPSRQFFLATTSRAIQVPSPRVADGLGIERTCLRNFACIVRTPEIIVPAPVSVDADIKQRRERSAPNNGTKARQCVLQRPEDEVGSVSGRGRGWGHDQCEQQAAGELVGDRGRVEERLLGAEERCAIGYVSVRNNSVANTGLSSARVNCATRMSPPMVLLVGEQARARRFRGAGSELVPHTEMETQTPTHQQKPLR
ncbi:hypothetical protein DFH06DRAFT_1148585 [Mycena polygramma]|nr:hypothetical protein DFH06DRAFT_1148585 [Mycena polygramma]